MRLTLQKRLAAGILGCSEKRVVFDSARLEDVKEAITKTDIRLLIGEGAVKEKPKAGVSRVRANIRKTQRSKGLRKGEGRRKGKATARESRKDAWMKRIRAQRKFLKHLKKKELIKPTVFKELYTKSKGGFFRSIKHIKLHLEENKLFSKPEKIVAKPEPKSENANKKENKKEHKKGVAKEVAKKRNG